MPKCYICKRDIPKGGQYETWILNTKGSLVKKNVCNKDEWDKYTKEMEYRKLIFEALHDYMGYDLSQIVPPVVSKEVSVLHERYTYRVIYNVVRSLENNIRIAMKNDFKNDFVKGKYVAAILMNNINDEYEKLKRQTKMEQNRAKQHVDIEMIEDESVSKPVSRGNDISMFL